MTGEGVDKLVAALKAQWELDCELLPSRERPSWEVLKAAESLLLKQEGFDDFEVDSDNPGFDQTTKESALKLIQRSQSSKRVTFNTSVELGDARPNTKRHTDKKQSPTHKQLYSRSKKFHYKELPKDLASDLKEFEALAEKHEKFAWDLLECVKDPQQHQDLFSKFTPQEKGVISRMVASDRKNDIQYKRTGRQSKAASANRGYEISRRSQQNNPAADMINAMTSTQGPKAPKFPLPQAPEKSSLKKKPKGQVL
jgi:hypothetical protein